MSKSSKKDSTEDKARAKKGNAIPKSIAIVEKGVRTSGDFMRLMSALMTDVLKENITVAVNNSVVNAGSKMLKCAELQIKYGQPQKTGRNKVLQLVEEYDNSSTPLIDTSV